MHPERPPARWIGPGLIGSLLGLVLLGMMVAYVVSVARSPERPAPASAARPAGAPANDARAAYERGNYDPALRLWSRAAENGDQVAQTGLGDMYRLGQGVPQDLAQAVQWYSRAAAQSVPEAQYQLGLLVTAGTGGARLNTDESLYWIKNAAIGGHVAAQYHVAGAHERGQWGALRVDPVEAAAWYGFAAANGHPDGAAAQARLLAGMNEQQRLFAAQRERELRSTPIR